MKEEHRLQRIASTQDAAEALLEDLRHIREVVDTKHQTRGQIRRLSVILRRLLIDDALSLVASPRIGRVELLAPQNDPFYRVVTPQNTDIFISGGVKISGFEQRAAHNGKDDFPFPPPGFDPDETVSLRVANFNKQWVIFWRTGWIKRATVIKFVANIAHGAHRGKPSDAEEELLENARSHYVIGRKAGESLPHIDPLLAADPDKVLMVEAELDMTMIELLAAASFLVRSPDVAKLEKVIRDEMKASRAS